MSTITLIGEHADRPTAFVERYDRGGWRMKIYGVAYERQAVRPELIEAARDLAGQHLPQPPHGQGRYGVGFIVVHDGRGGNWILLDWWANDNELNQHLFHSSDEAPLAP